MRSIPPLATPITRAAAGRSSVGSVPQVVANLAGLWEGTLFSADADIGIPFSLRHDDTAEGAAVGQLAFTGRVSGPADDHLLEASATTYVALVGPYYDPAAAEEVVTVLEGRTAGDRLYGTYCARPVSGAHATEGRFVAVRSRRAAA